MSHKFAFLESDALSSQKRQMAYLPAGNSTTCAMLFMIEPAVATVSICLPSIWSLVVYGFQRFPRDSFRSAWSKRYSILISSSRSSGKPRSASNRMPEPYIGSSFTYVVSPGNTTNNKRTSMGVEARDSSLSDQPSLVSAEKPQEQKLPVTRSMELEGRARDYYSRAAFSHGSRTTVQQYWNSSEDLEMARSTLRQNPLPVPPKR